jgi:hypothetical protein
MAKSNHSIAAARMDSAASDFNGLNRTVHAGG